MKPMFIAAILAAPILALSEPIVSEGKAPSPAELAAKCANGCVVLDPADVEHLQEGIQTALQGAFEQGLGVGYQQGAKEALEALKSNPKLCPKDI